MKLELHNQVFSLAAETDGERELCELLTAVHGQIFRLDCSTDRGFSLVEIGPEDTARRAPLNITFAVEARFAPISNLARTPFELDGTRFASIEAFWQGLKYPDAAKRQAIAKLSGPEAKDAGDAAGQPETIEYQRVSVRTGSPEHWALMRKACEAKFNQHPAAKEALLATGERWLTHRVRNDSRNIPGVVMADIWMQIRSQLRDEAGQA